METGGISAIQIVLWILVANLILILSAFGLVYWLRKQSREAIRKIGAQIQGFDQQMGELGRFLQSYSGIDQEPFFTPLDELQSEASQIEAHLHQFLTTCHIFEEEINQPGSNQLQNIINAPFIWFRRWQQSRELSHQAEEIANQMAEAENRMEQIFELPWELAAECRQASKEVGELSQHVQWLQAKAVGGITFNKVASQLPLLNQELDRVPAEYFEADKDRLLGASNLKSTIRVFEQLHAIRPAINRYLPQAREWRSSYEKAAAEYAGLRQEGANMRQALASPPAGLLIDPIQERLDQVAQLASELNQRLAQPEAEQLKSLAREINRLHRVLQDTGKQLTRAGQQVIELNRALTQLQEGLDNLASQFARPEQASRYPLVWDESRSTLGDLRSRFTGLGPIQQPRTPEQIQVHQVQAGEIMAGYKLLVEKTPAAVKQYEALVELLNSQPLQEGQTWLRQTREVIASAGQYDPKNWTKHDSLQTLPAELDELERLQTRLIPNDPGAPLRETQLGQRLKETQHLAALHKDLRPRAESILTRLQKIRSLEKEGKEKLTGTWNVLERVAILAESNTLLDEIVSTEIDRLGEEVRTLANELNAHQQGEIEKKSQKIQAQVDKVNQILNQWLASMNGTIADQVQKSSGILIQLDSITRIEDPPIEEARLLLKSEEVTALRGNTSPASIPKNLVGRVTNRFSQSEAKTSFEDLEVLAEIKRKNDLWQSLLAAQTALEEKSKPVLAANQQVVDARGEAKEQLLELAKKLPDRRVWPPSNQTPIAEDRALGEVDEKREGLKRRPATSELVVRDLERLAREYRLVAEHTQQVIDRVDQDQERVQEVEWQINSLKERWQSQLEPDNPIMREGVQQLLSQSDSRLAFIKQQYMQGTLSYEQVIRNLQLLYDEIFAAQVPIDAQNKVRLNEPHRRADQP